MASASRGVRACAVVSLIVAVALPVAGCDADSRLDAGSATPGSEQTALPTAFDLRDVDGANYVTPVKMQCGTSPDGLPDLGATVGACWGFASSASFESSLLLQGIVTDPTSPAADLSEWHLANWNGYNDPVYEFNTTPMPDTNPPSPSSYTQLEPVVKGWGGTSYWAIDYFSSGKGAVLESEAPFPTADITAHVTLTPPPETLPTTYRLREAHILRWDDFDDAEELRVAVKRALMDYGVVQSFVFFDAAGYPGQIGDSFYDKETYDLYVDDPALVGMLNHAVAIVGWDDERDVAGAPYPGAWLIKNSVGTLFGDEGYMWVSYADEVMLKEDSFAISFVGAEQGGYANPATYETHDGALSMELFEGGGKAFDFLSTGSGDSAADDWGAAQFVAEGDTTLMAVGVMNVSRGEDVEVAVFRGWTADGPGELVSSATLRLEDAGYYTIDLDTPVELADGEEFVVAVGFAGREGRLFDPLVYVQDDDASSTVPTYFGTRDSSGWGAWEEADASEAGRVFYVQAVVAED